MNSAIFSASETTEISEPSTEPEPIQVDVTAPSIPASVDDGSTYESLTSSPLISWSASTDLESGVKLYQVALGTNSGGIDIYPWTSVGNLTSATINGLSLVSGVTYYASIRAVDESGNTSGVQSGNGWTAHAPITCPTNFVSVPPLVGYTTASFCVAKYEMKLQYNGSIVADGNVSNSLNYDSDYDIPLERAKYVAVSVASGRPWVQIKRGENGSASGQGAIEACQGLGGNYDLISNSEWQTIARNIEGVASNWANSTIGDAGGITRGHSAGGPSQSIEASSNDSDGCFQKTQTNCMNSGHVDHSQKRVFQLSNGNIVWDFAGNVYEWTKDNNNSAQGPNGYVSQIVNGGSFSIDAKDKFGPLGDYLSLSVTPFGGLGYASLNSSAGAIRRGGYWTDQVDSGVFRTSLSSAPSAIINMLGFRCVYR